MISTELKETFDRIVDAFLFLDKNGDGKLNKKDVDKSLNEFYPWEKSPGAGNIWKNPFSIDCFPSIHFFFFVFKFLAVIVNFLLISRCNLCKTMQWRWTRTGMGRSASENFSLL